MADGNLLIYIILISAISMTFLKFLMKYIYSIQNLRNNNKNILYLFCKHQFSYSNAVRSLVLFVHMCKVIFIIRRFVTLVFMVFKTFYRKHITP